VIKSFGDKALARFHATGEKRGLKVGNIGRLQRLLDALDKVRRPEAMNVPGFGFHPLKGNRAGTYSVWINGNWRLTFGWDEGATDVALEDYH
jgi:toxin HigB-1